MTPEAFSSSACDDPQRCRKILIAEPGSTFRHDVTGGQVERRNRVICPTGGLLTGLSSLLFLIFRKIFVAT